MTDDTRVAVDDGGPQLVGKEGVEASQGWSPLADPSATGEPDAFGSDHDGLASAAQELVIARLPPKNSRQ